MVQADFHCLGNPSSRTSIWYSLCNKFISLSRAAGHGHRLGHAQCLTYDAVRLWQAPLDVLDSLFVRPQPPAHIAVTAKAAHRAGPACQQQPQPAQSSLLSFVIQLAAAEQDDHHCRGRAVLASRGCCTCRPRSGTSMTCRCKMRTMVRPRAGDIGEQSPLLSGRHPPVFIVPVDVCRHALSLHHLVRFPAVAGPTRSPVLGRGTCCSDSGAAEYDGWPSASAATWCSPCCSSSRRSRRRRRSRTRLNICARWHPSACRLQSIRHVACRAGRSIGTARPPTRYTGPQPLRRASVSNCAVQVLTMYFNLACCDMSS